jgi:hypothetical protein
MLSAGSSFTLLPPRFIDHDAIRLKLTPKNNEETYDTYAESELTV